MADIPISPEVASVRCGHPGVRAEIEPPQRDGELPLLVLRYRCGAATRPPASALCVQFYVHLYRDIFAGEILDTWKISITILHRIQVSGRVAEVSQVRLKLLTSTAERELRVFSSRPSLLMPTVDGNNVMQPGEECYAAMDLICRTPGGADVVVNVVDLFSHECFARYLVSTSSNVPTIKDTYELDVASHTGAGRKVKYTNPYDTPRIFHITTDRPDLLQFVRQSFEFGPRETHLFGLMLTATNSIQLTLDQLLHCTATRIS